MNNPTDVNSESERLHKILEDFEEDLKVVVTHNTLKEQQASRALAYRLAEGALHQQLEAKVAALGRYTFKIKYWYQDRTGYYFDTQPRRTIEVCANNQREAFAQAREVLPANNGNRDFVLRLEVQGIAHLTQNNKEPA